MGKFKGHEARYNVLSVRVDDGVRETFGEIAELVQMSVSSYLRYLVKRECNVYREECERASGGGSQ